MSNLLLIVDMQEGFRHLQSEKILPNILKLINGFKGEVIFSCFKNSKNSLFEKKLKWKKFQNIDNISLLKELQDFDFLKIYHTGYTILNRRLLDVIKEKSIANVYICGIYTDVCIKKTAMDLFDSNKSVYIIADACASLHGNKHHKYAIDSLKHIIGKNNILLTKGVLKEF